MNKEYLREFYAVGRDGEVILKPGWAKAFVEAEEPIYKALQDEFIDELNSPDEKYRRELEESINWHGVRWK